MARSSRISLRDDETTRRRVVDATNFLLAATAERERQRYWRLDASLGPFGVGTFMAYDAAWVLADNTDADRRARLVIVAGSERGYFADRRPGPLEWKSHGIGSLGDHFWLGTAGGVTTTRPVGPTVFVVQRLGIVLDANNVLLEWDTPELEGAP